MLTAMSPGDYIQKALDAAYGQGRYRVVPTERPEEFPARKVRGRGRPKRALKVEGGTLSITFGGQYVIQVQCR